MQKVLTLLIILMMIQPTHAQIEKRLDQVAKEVEATMQAKNVPALSISIVYQGEAYFINKGRLDRNGTQDVDECSIYQIASLGKILIGYLVHNLLMENKLQLTQPITDFLPPMFTVKRLEKLRNVTIEDLLHHTSGLPQDARGGYRRKDGEPYHYNYTEADLYADLQKLKIKSGKKYQYSNIGYALLAHIAGEAAGISYDSLLLRYLVKPYQLENTTPRLSEEQESQLATPYRKNDRNVKTAPWKMGLLTPPSAIYSTVADLTKLMQEQLIAYKEFYENGSINPWVLTQNKVPKSSKMNVFYGYGFSDWGNGVLGHGGDMDGYASIYLLNPEADFGMVLLTSSGENWIGPLASKVGKIMVGK